MIRKLLPLNGIAILLVVFHHVVDISLLSMTYWADVYRPGAVIPNYDFVGKPFYWFLFGIDQFGFTAIALFLFVNALFLMMVGGKNHQFRWRFLFTRISLIVVPYLVWSVLITLLRIVMGQPVELMKFFENILLGQTVMAFHYIPMVVVFTLVTPFLVPLVLKRWQILVGLAAVMQLIVIIGRYELFLNPQSSAQQMSFWKGIANFNLGYYFIWFALGLVAGTRITAMTRWLEGVSRYLFIAASVFLALGLAERFILQSITGRYFLTPTVGLFAQVWITLFLLTYLGSKQSPGLEPLLNRLGQLGVTSFAIYLMHVPILEIGAKVVYNLAPWLLGQYLLFFIFECLLAVGLPLLAIRLFNLIPPLKPFSKYVFG